MTPRNLAALLLIALAGACTHSYRFEHTGDMQPVKLPKLTGKTLALDLSGVPPAFEADASGHHFTIVDLRDTAGDMVRRIFADERVVSDPAAAEVVLRLGLSLRMGSTFTGASCTAVARWDVAARERTGSAEATRSSAVGAIANGGRNCEIATIGAVAEALDASLAKL